MIGHDLTLAQGGGRAMMQYGENYGYLHGDILTVLQPHQPAVQWRWRSADAYQLLTGDEVDAELLQRTLAHALWPGLVYRQQAYTLPHLRLATRVTTATAPVGPGTRPTVQESTEPDPQQTAPLAAVVQHD